jgi:hypothetical protein
MGAGERLHDRGEWGEHPTGEDAGGNERADGIAFVIQAQGTEALNALYATSPGDHAGGGLGIGGLPSGGLQNSFGVWLDTFFDDGQPVETAAGDSVSFFANDGAGATANPGHAPIALAELELGQWHDLTIAWTPPAAGDTVGTLTYTLQVRDASGGSVGAPIVRAQAFDTAAFGTSQAYLGFTGATGAATNTQQVRIIQLESVSDDPTVGVSGDISEAGDATLSAIGSVVLTDPDLATGDTVALAGYNAATDLSFSVSGPVLEFLTFNNGDLQSALANAFESQSTGDPLTFTS